MKISDVSGIILAGGGSKRMGYPKPFLEICGKRMIDIVLEKLRQIFTEVIIVTDKKKAFLVAYESVKFQDCKVIEDVIKDCGPLGGIYTGLSEINSSAAFFVACDMPNLHNELILRLIDSTDLKRYECTVPKHSGGIEPLHAVYSRQVLPKVEKILSSGKLSLREVLVNCRCKYVDVDENEVSSFININTPDDVDRLFASNP